MRLMEKGDRLVWLVRRNDDDTYLTSVSHSVWGSMRAAHLWKRKHAAEAQAERYEIAANGNVTFTAVPFALIEVDPDSIYTPQPVTKSPELEKMLEAKI